MRRRKRIYNNPLSSMLSGEADTGMVSYGNKGTGASGEDYTQLSWNAPEQQYQNAARNYLEDQWRKKLRGEPTWANAGHMYDPTQTAPMMRMFNYILTRPNIERGVYRAYQQANQEALQRKDPEIREQLTGNISEMQNMRAGIDQRRSEEIANRNATYESRIDYMNRRKMLDDAIKAHEDYLSNKQEEIPIKYRLGG